MSTQTEFVDADFLEQRGVIHEITVSPTGSPTDPWPFMLTVHDGHGEASALLHEEDADEIIAFFTRHKEAHP